LEKENKMGGIGGLGGGGGNNPLFEPFMDSLRIAAPIVMQQRQLDAAKERQDQLFLAHKQELLQKAEEAKTKFEIETSMKFVEGTLNNLDVNNPEQVMRAKAAILNLERGFGRPIAPRDETGEISIGRWGKPEKPTQQYDIQDTDKGLMFIPKDPDSGLTAKPTGFNAPPKKWEVQPPTPTAEKSPIIDRVDKGDHVLLFMRDGTTRREDKNLPPQKGEQGTKPPKDYVFDAESGTMKLIEGSPTFIKQKDSYSKDIFRFETINSKLGILEKSAEELINHPGLAAISGRRSYIPDVLNQDAQDASAKMDSLGSKLATQAISEMREASKTGGALGNTSDADIILLKSSVESLKAAQSVEQKKQSLENIIDVARGSRNRMERAFKSQWGDWSERIYKKPINNKSLDITTLPEDDLKKKLGIIK
jgi:hypothetical protein